MKSKDQKRAEAIARAAKHYVESPFLRKRFTEEEYLDRFRSKSEKKTTAGSHSLCPF